MPARPGLAGASRRLLVAEVVVAVAAGFGHRAELHFDRVKVVALGDVGHFGREAREWWESVKINCTVIKQSVASC